MAGQNIGAGELKRAKKTMTTGLMIALGISALVFLVVEIFPRELLTLFTSETDVVETGITFLRLAASEYMIVTPVFCMNGLAIGAGYTNVALLNAISSSIIIRVPLAYLLVRVFDLGFNGIGIAHGLCTHCLALHRNHIRSERQVEESEDKALNFIKDSVRRGKARLMQYISVLSTII